MNSNSDDETFELPESNETERRLQEAYEGFLADLAAERTLDFEGVFADRPDLVGRIPDLVEKARLAFIREGRRHPLIPGFSDFEVLGRGGMSVVYLAREENLDRKVALKVLPEWMSTAERSRTRFLQEARSLAKLSHPNVVMIHSIIETGGVLAFSMEHLKGQGLDKLLDVVKNVPEHKRMRAVQQHFPQALEADLGADYYRFMVSVHRDIACALEEVHKAGLIHRDVKPSNILFRADGTPVLADFGIVRIDSGVTLTQDYVGTPLYSAPEQVDSAAHVDARADVYSLGMTLYEALALHSPVKGKTSAEIVQIVQRGEIPQLRDVANVEKDLETVVMKAIDADPTQRYATMTALRRDLSAVLEGRPVLGRSLPLRLKLLRSLRRQSRKLVAAGIVLAIAGGSTIAYAEYERQEQTAREERLQEARELSDRAYIELDFSRSSKTAESLFRQALAQDPNSLTAIVGLALVVKKRSGKSTAFVELERWDPDYNKTAVLRWLVDSEFDLRALAQQPRGEVSPETAFECFVLGWAIFASAHGHGTRKTITEAASLLRRSVLLEDPLGEVPPLAAYIQRAMAMKRAGIEEELTDIVDYMHSKFKGDPSMHWGIGRAASFARAELLGERHALAIRQTPSSLWKQEIDKALELDAHFVPALLERAIMHRYVGDIDGSLAEFRELAESHPEFAIVRGEYLLTLNLWLEEAAEKRAEASKAYERAKKAKDYSLGREMRAEAERWNRILKERGVKALEASTPALEDYPGDSRFWRLQGNLYEILGDLKKSLEIYGIALGMDRLDHTNWHHYATILRLTNGDPEDIGEAYEEAAELAPGRFGAQKNAFIWFRNVGNPDKVITYVQRALAIDPSNFDSQFVLGMFLCLNRQYEDAVEILGAARLLNPTGKNRKRKRNLVALYLGNAYYGLGDYSNASTFALEFANAEPQDYRGHGLLGMIGFVSPDMNVDLAQVAIKNLTKAVRLGKEELVRIGARAAPSFLRTELEIELARKEIRRYEASIDKLRGK